MDDLLSGLETWLPKQRWFARSSRPAKLAIVGSWSPAGPGKSVQITVYLIRDDNKPATVYQVPIVQSTHAMTQAAPALIAEAETHDAGSRYWYDGVHDLTFSTALLRVITGEETIRSTPQAGPVIVQGRCEPGVPQATVTATRVLTGEQSNTSIIYRLVHSDGTPAAPIICKLFRTLAAGDNPDVELQQVLGRAGSPHVPRPIGSLEGQWPHPAEPSGVATGQLAVAQEFIPEAEDAWRVAMRSAEHGDDFTTAASQLGQATAEVHRMLARELPTHPATPATIAQTMASMNQRLTEAAQLVPAAAQLSTTIRAVYTAAQAAPWPRLQRIHGDLHLGQVLSTPNGRWLMIDFEGEPLRPLSERSAPDVPLRDIAGMLRSFDYVGGSYAKSHNGLTIRSWVAECRQAFEDGYARYADFSLAQYRQLLLAFEIDKAVYELVYEARHRPDWLSIPLAAIHELVSRLRDVTA